MNIYDKSQFAALDAFMKATRMRTRTPDPSLLDDLDEFLDRYADADDGVPNDAMRLRVRLAEARGKS